VTETRLHPRPPVELLRSTHLHRGPVFDVVRDHVRLPSGREQKIDVVRHGGAVAIAARRPTGELVLVRQYRHAVGDWLLELPAGRLEPGEAPLCAARRELEEETGLVAERWSELTRFFAAPGFCSEELVVFLAEGLRPAGTGRREPDADEEIELEERTPAQILAGAARDAKTLLAAALLLGAAPDPAAAPDPVG